MSFQNNLDKYSQEVIAFIQESYSYLLEIPFQMNFSQNDDAKTFFIEIKIKTKDSYLSLNSQDEKITIGFSNYHAHFGGWQDSNFEKDIKDAILTFEAIKNGKLVVIEYYENKEFKGSLLVENQNKFDEEELLRRWKFGKSNSIEISIFEL